MIVIVVAAAEMVGHIRRSVVIDGAALIFRVEIFQDDAAHPVAFLQLHLCSHHDVLERIVEVALLLLLHEVLAFGIAIIVEEEHLRMVFKVMVGIERSTPSRHVVVQA